MRLLEDILAEEILSKRLKEGDTALVDVDEDGKVFIKSENDNPLLAKAGS